MDASQAVNVGASPDEDAAYAAAVREAEGVIEEARHRYSPAQRALAFNGGKVMNHQCSICSPIEPFSRFR
jgi:hypothetical protein